MHINPLISPIISSFTLWLDNKAVWQNLGHYFTLGRSLLKTKSKFNSNKWIALNVTTYLYPVEDKVSIDFADLLSSCRTVQHPNLLTHTVKCLSLSLSLSLFRSGAHLPDPNPADVWGLNDKGQLLRLAPCCQSPLPEATVEDSRGAPAITPEEWQLQDGHMITGWHPHLKPEWQAGEDWCPAADTLCIFLYVRAAF